MANLHGFDANQVEPSSDFEPIPAGKYLALITESEMKANKAGTGSYLQFTFQILEGPHKERKVWTRLNLAGAENMAAINHPSVVSCLLLAGQFPSEF
ncbi:MAG: DUF669 domain-containing protein [Gemmataceae bacterium]